MVDLETLAQAQQAIIEAGETLYRAGQVPATGGNFSVRLGESQMAVTASGRHKGRLAAADILVTDLKAVSLEAHRKPSAEALLHGQLYADRPEVGAILHTHSKPATLLSLIVSEDTLWLSGYELLKALEGVTSHDASVAIPILDNTQDMQKLAGRARERLGQVDGVAYLIRGHGLYTWATDIQACLRQVEALDFLFDCELFLRR